MASINYNDIPYYGIPVLINLGLALFVFTKNPRGKVNRYFALFIIFIVAWIATLFLYFGTNNEASLLLVGKINFVCTTLMAFFIWRFTHYYPVVIDLGKSSYRYYITLFLTIVIALLTIGTSLVVEKESVIDGAHVTTFGPLYALYFAHFLWLCVIAIINLLRKLKKVERAYQQQIFYFATGLGIAIIAAVTTNIILPFVFNIYDFQSWAPLFTIFFAATTTYAIVRYRLMEIRSIFSRSIVYALMVLGVSTLLISTVFIATRYLSSTGAVIFDVIASLLIVLLIDPFKRIVARLTNKLFFSAAIDYEGLVKKLTDVINNELTLHPLIKKCQAMLFEGLRVNDVHIFLAVDEAGNRYIDALSKEERYLEDGNPIIDFLRKSQGPLDINEIDRRISDEMDIEQKKYLNKVRDSFEKYDAALIASIDTEKGMVGIIMFEEKKSGQLFSKQDTQLVELIAPQLASGIIKARLYEEEKNFNQKLKSEIAKATIDLTAANNHLKELDTAKSEFMSIASHQLRTPLAGIMGYLSMLLGGDYGKINPDQKQVLDDIMSAGQRLTRLVNAFLNATRIEAGRLSINYTDVPFNDIIESMYKELKPTADKKHVTLSFKTNPSLPVVTVDVDKLKDVVLNLTDNAIKYSPGATVTVWGEQVDEKTVRFVSKDTGVGIPKGQAAGLFNKFVRGSGIAQVEPNGSGLGLFIAKKIIEAHGGKIWAESEGEGKGSTFQFEVPIKAAKVTAQPKTAETKAAATGPDTATPLTRTPVSAAQKAETTTTPAPATAQPAPVKEKTTVRGQAKKTTKKPAIKSAAKSKKPTTKAASKTVAKVSNTKTVKRVTKSKKSA